LLHALQSRCQQASANRIWIFLLEQQQGYYLLAEFFTLDAVVTCDQASGSTIAMNAIAAMARVP
jgi:hypothetical protein